MSYRNALNGDKPGCYQLATRAGKSTLNPGETLYFEQYITGYGNILTAKIQAYISTDAFVSDKSIIRHSLKKVARSETHYSLTWGNAIDNPTETGYTCVLSGVQAEINDEPTMVFDIDQNDDQPLLLCEYKAGHAPFEFELKTKKDIGPGEYYIDFYLTYFNGEVWVSSKERVPFKIRNFFERNARTISTLAIIASASGIIRFLGAPAYDFILGFLTEK